MLTPSCGSLPHPPVQIAVLVVRVKAFSPARPLSLSQASKSSCLRESPPSLNFSGPLNHTRPPHTLLPYTHSRTGHDHAADNDDDKKKGQQQPTGRGVGGGGGSAPGSMAGTRGSGM